ncbi:asparagine synthase (glutamine-hydrolyzing) [Roseimicrobium sp. ORNL1]|uniref:asparagine synthase (glutamine-hydrolyzing) n=1 Tax=Roseimicrobium sp. ORNL1 TaxID=2711231 RepID=UPI0013E1A5A6|nr:asparagine synthase (glutamine-hydrolyzing) [Roseimicrobium sp. ORNL1]QIF04136.1 asparagine synthase (glutamine-hydrolyzing) [Roseimicrobium sp. ORNL1]
MCGIAGMLDMAGERDAPVDVVRSMARAIFHRGPDEEGFLWRPGLGMASRRLSIVGLADGQQPMNNEDRSVHVVFNGELFDHVEKRAELQNRGHILTTHCDTEIIPHMWEDHREGMFERLRGQFAIALWDEKKKQLTLGRDRFGIAPLYWTRQGDWLLFASEIKGLLASGMVPARPDRRGIDHVFTFSAMPGPVTCFEGVNCLPPARFLQITKGNRGDNVTIQERAYWKMDFPDAGQEVDGDAKTLVDEFEQLILKAVEKRLRADVPVGSYLSGGVDSSMILALASHVKGKDIHTYTVQVDEPGLDELDAASMVAKHVGVAPPIVQKFRTEDALNTYPSLIRAAECPVIDTSCASLLQLAHRVHTNGQKVVLTGEGADEWLIGYPWYKISKALGYLDLIPGVEISDNVRRAFLKISNVPNFPAQVRRDIEKVIGGNNPWIDSYGVLCVSKLRFYSPDMLAQIDTTAPWSMLDMDLDRATKWHPLNRGVWMAGRVNLAGHLLQAKGDRVAMHSSVEVRYPFLDEDVFDFTAKIHPRWKLRGFRDKHILRLLAERWVPPFVYKRGKVIFRAPLDSFHLEPEPKFVAQLLSEESLRRTGYFDPQAVRHWRKAYTSLRAGSLPRLSIELGLAAVVATQLWHHLYIDSSLCELPSVESGSPQTAIVA